MQQEFLRFLTDLSSPWSDQTIKRECTGSKIPNSVLPPWPRQTEDVIVALEVLGDPFELLPPEVGLLEVALLDHGPHGTVQDQDPLGERGYKVLSPL